MARVEIRIDKGSSVAVTRQLTEQIVFLIASGKLKPGAALPSVREMALRHRIHPNTVSIAYQDLVERHWLTRQRGRKMTVCHFDEHPPAKPQDLDDLITATLRAARERGYSMQELRARLTERLLNEAPDHVLLVEDEVEMRQLVRQELLEVLPCGVNTCTPDDLSVNQGPAIGTLVVSLPGRVWNVMSLLPRGRQVCSLKPSDIDTHLEAIRKLKHPSLIVIASISEVFLFTARAVLAPLTGRRHALEVCHLEKGPKNLAGADLVFCDSLARSRVKAGRIVPYRIVSAQSAEEIAGLVAEAPKRQRRAANAKARK